MTQHLNKDSIFTMVMFFTVLGTGLIIGFFVPRGIPRVAMSNIYAPVILLVALYAIHYIPAIYIGSIFLCAGIIFLVSDALNNTYGVHSLAAVIAVLLSYAALMQSHIAGLNIKIISLFSAVLVLILNAVARFGTGFRARRLQHKLQTEININDKGVVVEIEGLRYKVCVNDTLWDAESNYILHEGQHVTISEKRDLLLYVEPDTSS